MAKETTNQGYIDAQAYATDPDNVSTPDSLHQEYEIGINSYSLVQAGEAADLASVITVDTANNFVGIGTGAPQGTLQLQAELALAGDAASFNLKQDGVAVNDGYYIERAGQRNGHYVYVGGATDSLIITANDAGTQSESIQFSRDGNVLAGGDNVRTLGGASNRWSEVFAGNGTINTSDSREKTVQADNSSVLDAIDSISIKAFKWNDAIDAKGEANARIHYGVLAQEVKAAFEAQGLVAEDYGVLCYDEWDEVTDDENNIIREAGNRYGVRYDQLYALKIAALERKIAALTP